MMQSFPGMSGGLGGGTSGGSQSAAARSLVNDGRAATTDTGGASNAFTTGMPKNAKRRRRENILGADAQETTYSATATGA